MTTILISIALLLAFILALLGIPFAIGFFSEIFRPGNYRKEKDSLEQKAVPIKPTEKSEKPIETKVSMAADVVQATTKAPEAAVAVQTTTKAPEVAVAAQAATKAPDDMVVIRRAMESAEIVRQKVKRDGQELGYFHLYLYSDCIVRSAWILKTQAKLKRQRKRKVAQEAYPAGSEVRSNLPAKTVATHFRRFLTDLPPQSKQEAIAATERDFLALIDAIHAPSESVIQQAMSTKAPVNAPNQAAAPCALTHQAAASEQVAQPDIVSQSLPPTNVVEAEIPAYCMEYKPEDMPTEPAATTQTATKMTEHHIFATYDPRETIVGELVNFQPTTGYDQVKKTSYNTFEAVILTTANGESEMITRRGVDLERAITDSGAQRGDQVKLRFFGKVNVGRDEEKKFKNLYDLQVV